jgi:hypothetical protein
MSLPMTGPKGLPPCLEAATVKRDRTGTTTSGFLPGAAESLVDWGVRRFGHLDVISLTH